MHVCVDHYNTGTSIHNRVSLRYGNQMIYSKSSKGTAYISLLDTNMLLTTNMFIWYFHGCSTADVSNTTLDTPVQLH